MNKDNILKVADAIEQHSIADLGFNMSMFSSTSVEDVSGHNCGTTACIGGWANAVAANGDASADLWDSGKAQSFLGLNDANADFLFFAWNFPEEGKSENWFEKIAPKKAVAVLRHLAETGEVDWSVA